MVRKASTVAKYCFILGFHRAHLFFRYNMFSQLPHYCPHSPLPLLYHYTDYQRPPGSLHLTPYQSRFVEPKYFESEVQLINYVQFVSAVLLSSVIFHTQYLYLFVGQCVKANISNKKLILYCASFDHLKTSSWLICSILLSIMNYLKYCLPLAWPIKGLT